MAVASPWTPVTPTRPEATVEVMVPRRSATRQRLPEGVQDPQDTRKPSYPTLRISRPVTGGWYIVRPGNPQTRPRTEPSASPQKTLLLVPETTLRAVTLVLVEAMVIMGPPRLGMATIRRPSVK